MMRYLIFRYFVVLTAMLITFSGMAKDVYAPEDVPNVHLSDRNRFISDPEGYMSPQARSIAERKLREVMDSTTVETAIVIVPEVKGGDIFGFAQQLSNDWGLGKADKNNGLLVVFDMNNHKVWMHTGKGMEGVMTDIRAKRIIEETVVPRMREDGLDSAVPALTERIAETVYDPEAADLRSELENDDLDLGQLWYYFIRFAIAMAILAWILLLVKLYRLRGQDNYHKALALNDNYMYPAILTAISLGIGCTALIAQWLLYRHYRNKPISCDICGTKMNKLGEEEDNAFLDQGQDLEERLSSVDYDVWSCPQCGGVEIFPFKSKVTEYEQCPRCGVHAMHLLYDRIERQPTTRREGQGVKVYECKNCGHRDNRRYNIAKLVTPVVVPMGIGRGGGGGGGFSGGSWGGGSFGGGGAGGSW